MSYRVLIVEDHLAMREGLVSLVEFEDDLAVCDAVGSAEAAMPLIESMAPDVALVDLQLPGRTGIELVEWLRASGSPTRALVVSAHEEELYGLRAIGAGARGYLAKRNAALRLGTGVREIAEGGWCLSAWLRRQLLTEWLGVEELPSIPSDTADDEITVFERVGRSEDPAATAKTLDVTLDEIGALREALSVRLGFASGREYERAAQRWMSSLE